MTVGRLLLALCGLGLFALSAAAGTPRLSRVTPPGGQRGTTVEVQLVGRHLDQPREVLFYETGITAEAVEAIEGTVEIDGRKQPVEPGTRVRVRLKLAADCPLGAHGLRVRTADGLTEYHRFFVGPFPTVDETETSLFRNDKRETAQPVPLNRTVHGRLLEPADVDFYRVEAKRGQRLSAEVEAARLGTERGIPDLHLAIFDADGQRLAAADDSALFVQDPVLALVAPRDGAYFVEVRHGMYNGSGEAYRLHVGTFARPTAVYPAGGPAGEELSVELRGDPAGAWKQSAKLPAAVGGFDLVPTVDDVPTPSPFRLRVSPFPNVLEAEPNDTPEAVASTFVAPLPVAFNGVIDKPGDVDCFVFQAKKGAAFRFHALANALGSPVDPVIWIKPRNGKGGTLRAADSRSNQLGLAPTNGLIRDTHDPILEFTAPADGEYVLGVEDERGGGGPGHVYRVEVTPEANAVYTYIAPEAENQNQPQLRQAISVAAGNRMTAQVGVFATGRPSATELELVALNLPTGVTMHAPRLAPGMTKVSVVFEATADAPPAAALVELKVQPAGGGPTLDSGFRQTVMLNLYGNNDYYLHVPVERLAVAVTDPAPFRVEVDEPKSALVQNGEMAVRFQVVRSPGYDGPVTVQMDWRPTGLSTGTPVTVPAGKTDGTYLLGASRGATAGRYAVTFTATDGGFGRRNYRDTGGRTYVASRPFTLSVAEPHIEARIGRASVERGKTAQVVCKLNHLQPFDGPAKVTLGRLPRGVELVEPVREITAADKEVTFTVRASGEALVGNYQGVVLDVTVTDHGQTVRQLSGSGVLRVDAERGVPGQKK